MMIDRETFTEIAVHLKLASDAVLKIIRALSMVSNTHPEVDFGDSLDAILGMNKEILFLERTLHAVMEANCDDVPSDTKLQ